MNLDWFTYLSPATLSQTTFAHPWVLWLLVFPVGLVIWRIWGRQQVYPTLRLPSLGGVAEHRQPWRGWMKSNLFWLRSLGLSLLIVALARPQLPLAEEDISAEGIDIMLVLDTSQSMNAIDFEPNRLEAAKEEAKTFVSQRPYDRIGLVLFASESFTQCPLTTDHTIVTTLIDQIYQGLLGSGTAIGMGLATAVNRLRDSEAKSRIIILLTDGDNNSGFIDPMTAVETAKSFGIKVYTIGIGTNGQVPTQSRDPRFGVPIVGTLNVKLDEKLLRAIAEETGGAYFNALNKDQLGDVYEQIDQLEKSKIEVTRISRRLEIFFPFLLLGGFLLFAEWLLRYTVVRHIP